MIAYDREIWGRKGLNLSNKFISTGTTISVGQGILLVLVVHQLQSGILVIDYLEMGTGSYITIQDKENMISEKMGLQFHDLP